MSQNTAVMKAVESLDYRVTLGDVAAQAGLDLNMAQQGLLALASDTQAHLQVSDTGEIAYEFPKNFRAILRNKYWRIRLQETWDRIWGILFYLIRISFGILLMVSILLIVAAIVIIAIAASSSQRDDDQGGGSFGGGMVFLPRFWIGDLFWFFNYDYGYSRRRPRQTSRRGKTDGNDMNFLEAIFSFLFGDGDPNDDLEDRRWQAIGAVIRNNGGAIAAEQAAPYLDDLKGGDEDYILPVLSRFNGIPEVSPQGEIVYYFPELQVTASERGRMPVAAYLKENLRAFSRASGGQITVAIGLGIFNFVGAIVLGGLLQDQAMVAELGGLVAFASGIYWLLLGYGTAFLAIPTVRYFWLKGKNLQIAGRNEARQAQAMALNSAPPQVRDKISYAQQFATNTVVGKDRLAYTTEKDLIEQNIEQKQQLDAEWEQRLKGKDG